MPVFFERAGDPPVRIPLCETTFLLGQDLGCHLVVNEEGVAPQHARIGFVHGEYVVTSVGDAALWVNGEPAPLFSLRDGDSLSLSPPAQSGSQTLRFRNLLQGAFLPPGTPRVTAALGLKAKGPLGPQDLGPGEPLAGADATRTRLVTTASGVRLVVKTLPALRADQDPDAWYRVLTSLAGAPHPDLALVVDGGYVPGNKGAPQRWIATRFAPGADLRTVLAQDGLPAIRRIEVLRALARALTHLHARGLVHGDVSPGNLIVDAQGRSTLIDYEQVRHWREPGGASQGVVGTPGYVAPEEVLGGAGRGRPPADVYGLGAIGYALFAGAPPAASGEVLATLGASLAPAAPLSSLGVQLPAALDDLLLSALHPDPAGRPPAAAIGHALDQVAARAWRGA